MPRPPFPPDPTVPAAAIAGAVTRGETTAVAVVQSALDRIAAANPRYNAFLSVSPHALDDAGAVDAAVARGAAGPLAGVPLAIKDLIIGRDGPTTAGSRVYGAGLTSRRDAPVLKRLKAAGAIVVGRTNLHEMALGVTNENEHFGVVRNPWDLSRIPGGSSGGSAVAVALGLVPAALGTDTRGSIRIPAAACGITGFKPTYGLVSTQDVVPLASTMDHVGPMTRSVADAVLLLGAMAGGRHGERWRQAIEQEVTGMRIGVCDFLMRDLDPEVERCVREAIEVFAPLGASVADVAVPEFDGSLESSAVICLAEAGAHYEPYLRDNPEGIGRQVRQRLEGVLKLSAMELVRAQQARPRAAAGCARVFRRFDVIVGATIPAAAGVIGTNAVRIADADRPALPELTRLTSAMNLAGVPALSVPCGFTAAGLPVGLQIVAASGKDHLALRAGAAYQRATDWHERRPTLSH